MTTSKTIAKRLDDLERAAAPAGNVPILQGLAADGSPQYLNCVTGEISGELPPRSTVIKYLLVDLNEI